MSGCSTRGSVSFAIERCADPPEPTTVGPDEAGAFLAEHLGHSVIVDPLGEGMWSRAFAFRHDGRDLVARFGQHRRGLADPANGTDPPTLRENGAIALCAALSSHGILPLKGSVDLPAELVAAPAGS